MLLCGLAAFCLTQLGLMGSLRYIYIFSILFSFLFPIFFPGFCACFVFLFVSSILACVFLDSTRRSTRAKTRRTRPYLGYKATLLFLSSKTIPEHNGYLFRAERASTLCPNGVLLATIVLFLVSAVLFVYKYIHHRLPSFATCFI